VLTPVLLMSTLLALTLLPIPCALHRRLHTCISTDSGLTELAGCMQRHPWLDGAGELNAQAVGEWVGDLGSNHPNLRKVVGAVVAVMKADSEETKLELLTRRDHDGSVGIVLAQFAAAEEQYCVRAPVKGEDVVLPSWSVQCDVQGNIMVGAGTTEP